MKITLAGKGRFHGFDLARELDRQGHLERYVTTYPKFMTKRWGIDTNKVVSLWPYEVLERVWNKLNHRSFIKWNPQYFYHDMVDKALAKQISEESDLVVLGSTFATNGLEAARDYGTKVAVVDHGSTHIRFQQRLLVEEYRKEGFDITPTHPRIVEKGEQEYEEADYITLPSEFVIRSFMEMGVPREKLVKIPYGVNLKHFYPSTDCRNKSDIFRIIQVGTVCIRKGTHYLLRAFTELNIPNSELILVGHISEDGKRILKKFNLKNVRVLGAVRQSELVHLYHKATVFCLASIEEGLAMVTLQAMACGLPVICTVNTGAEDLIDDGEEGFLIPPCSVDNLKENIMTLYESPNFRREMSRKGRSRIENGYSWKDYGERAVREYSNMLNNSF